MLSALVLTLSLAMAGSPVQASSTPPVPDIKDWTVVKTTDLSIVVGVQDGIVLYLGQIMEYQNPADPQEFADVVMRHVAIISNRQPKTKTELNQSIDLAKYMRRKESDALAAARKIAEPVAYRHWRTAHDPLTNTTIISGTAETWLFGFATGWMYSNTVPLTREIISEPALTKPDGINYVVGLRLSLGDAYHILRADPATLDYLLKKPRAEEDEEK